MLHAICDFCGEDTGRNATMLTMKPFMNFARYHGDTEPFGKVGSPLSFVICSECVKKHKLPNPYESYSGIDGQQLKYEKFLDNYTDLDLVNDDERDKEGLQKETGGE